ncbi:MAG: PIG-L family deacetylase, partial [Polyangiales bacterium]
GPLLEHFVLVTGQPAQRDPLDGVATSWAARYPSGGAAVDNALAEARKLLHRDHPERATAPLAAAARALAALPDADPRVRDARKQASELALRASGVFVRALSPRATCTPGATLPVLLELHLRRPAPIALRGVRLPDGQTKTLDKPLAVHEKRLVSADVHCADDATPSAPYWLAEPPLPGRQVVPDQRLLDNPAGLPPLSAAVDFVVDGHTLTLDVPFSYAYTDRVQGERERRVAIVPPLTVTPERDAVLFPSGSARSVQLRVRAGADAQRGEVSLELPPGYRSEPAHVAVELAHAGDERTVELKVYPPADALTRPPEYAQPVALVGGRRYALREDLIDYPHVPTQLVLQPARLRLTPLTVTKPHGTIGYVEGSGDTIAADLAHVGASVEMLNDRELMQADLSRFSAIVLGVRSFNTRDVLRAAHPRLMRYVEAGGVVLVQYVTRSGISPLDVPIGPYPLDIGRGRVTDERAAVTLLAADHPLLTRPHRLGPKDFEGWVQERGLYFAEHWDPRYQPLLELADPNEGPERGALLVARHGRGRYVYTGLSFFRQLPAGVPGAYRLLLNLITAGNP